MNVKKRENILSGIRVLDMGRVIAAPFCCRMLGDMGAEVIKIESPEGDMVRSHPPLSRAGSFGALFAQYNVGKKAICVNLRNKKGIELIKGLAAVSDIVVENFRPGLMDKMGLGYEILQKISEKIILCSISGYGQTGSAKDKAAFADIIHAYSGMEYMTMKIMGPGADPPGFAMSHADTYGGLTAALSIMAALFYRQATGEGQAIDLSLLDSILAVNDATLQGFIFSEGKIEKNNMPKLPIPMKDGHITMTPLLSFKGIANAMGRPELANEERFRTDAARMEEKNADEVMRIVRGWAKTVTVAEASELLERNKVPFSKVNSLAEIVNAPVVKERRMLVETVLEPSFPPESILNTPFHFSKCPTGTKVRPPYLGEHNRPVLKDLLGLNENDIDVLFRDGVIFEDPKVAQKR
jgi:crotonobetainyl-CoA:carnitine CoA-transferase CaiB-like acyl-CoA transferase